MHDCDAYGSGCGAPGLGLDYQQIGNLVGVLGIVWGVFALISGRISDAPVKVAVLGRSTFETT